MAKFRSIGAVVSDVLRHTEVKRMALARRAEIEVVARVDCSVNAPPQEVAPDPSLTPPGKRREDPDSASIHTTAPRHREAGEVAGDEKELRWLGAGVIDAQPGIQVRQVKEPTEPKPRVLRVVTGGRDGRTALPHGFPRPAVRPSLMLVVSGRHG